LRNKDSTFRFHFPTHSKSGITRSSLLLQELAQETASLRKRGLFRRLAGPPGFRHCVGET